MTAPDPGLTDLIAAHTLRVVELNEVVRYPECNGCDWVGGLVKDHAVHLASVVEQHTNRRIAELEAHAEYMGRELPNVAARIDSLTARAEKAEATVARVGAVIEDLVQNIADDEKTLRSPNVSVGEAQELPAVISVQQIYLDELRAALEGES